MKAIDVQQKLKSLASPNVAQSSSRYFKTGPGEYGEGDVFIGVRVPQLRKIAREFRDLPLKEAEVLLQSPIHEERLFALLVLVLKVTKRGNDSRKLVYELYLKNLQYINNWDLVDSSAPAIVGGYLESLSRRPLQKLAKSTNLWERRIAIIATQHFIRQNQFEDAISICQMLLNDKEDLIHKASGWMLREIGGRDVNIMKSFLDAHAAIMPRTMLRYAIEHLSAREREAYLQLKNISGGSAGRAKTRKK